jgi:hypothetical protein
LIRALIVLAFAAAVTASAAAPTRPPRAPEDASTVRDMRPATLSASVVGMTPTVGALLDMNLIPYVALGVGYGYYSSGSIAASFIPLYAHGYVFTSNFSPYVTAGADFVTLTFDSTSSLLNSTFKGTQFVLGGGLEYRFNFGLCARIEGVRYLNAGIWVPGLAIGYSLVVF